MSVITYWYYQYKYKAFSSILIELLGNVIFDSVVLLNEGPFNDSSLLKIN